MGAVALIDALQVTVGAVGQAIPDPAPSAPAGLVSRVGPVLAIVKWGSLAAIAVLLAASGLVVAMANSGRGGGMSPELKENVTKAVIGLVVTMSAVQIVQFFT
jgi:hypothetical protein